MLVGKAEYILLRPGTQGLALYHSSIVNVTAGFGILVRPAEGFVLRDSHKRLPARLFYILVKGFLLHDQTALLRDVIGTIDIFLPLFRKHPKFSPFIPIEEIVPVAG